MRKNVNVDFDNCKSSNGFIANICPEIIYARQFINLNGVYEIESDDHLAWEGSQLKSFDLIRL